MNLESIKELISQATRSMMAARAMELARAHDPEKKREEIDNYIAAEAKRYIEAYEGRSADEVLLMSILEMTKSDSGKLAIEDFLKEK